MAASDPTNVLIGVDLDMEQLSSGLVSVFNSAAAEIKISNAAIMEQNKAWVPILKHVHNLLEQHKSIFNSMDAQVRLAKDHPAMLKKLNEELKIAKEAISEMLDDIRKQSLAWPENDVELVKLLDHAEKIEKTIKRINEENNIWGKALKAFGLDKIVDSFKKWFSMSGQLAFWGKMFSEAGKQSSLWEQQNYRLYGSIGGVTREVNYLRAGTNMLQKEAVEAAKALAELSIDPSSMEAVGKAVGDFAVRSGASVESSAMFAKQLQALTGRAKSLETTLNDTRAAQEKFGLSGKNVTVVLDMLSRNMRNYTAEAKDVDATTKLVADRMMAWTGAAVKAGMAASDIAQIFDTLNTDATQYAALLGDKLASNDPSEMFGAMAENAGQFVDSFKDVPLLVRDSAVAFTGLKYRQLEQLDQAALHAAQAMGRLKGVTYENLKGNVELRKELVGLSTGIETATKFKEAMNKEIEKSPERQWAAAIDNLKQSILLIITPISQATAAIAKWFNWLLGLKGIGPILQWVIGAIASLVIGVVALATVLKLFGTSLVGVISKIFSFGKVATAGGSAASSGLRAMGQGINGFFSAFKSVNWGDIGKAAVAITLIGLSLAILAGALYLIKQSDANFTTLGILAGAMISLAVAARIAGGAVGDMIKAAIGMALMGAALIPMAFALNLMKDVGLGAIIAIMVMIVVMAVVLSALSSLAVPIIIVAAAFIVFGIALILIAVAALIAAHAFTIMAKLPFLQLAAGLMMLGAAVLFAGGMMMLGFPMMAVAMLIGASMIITAAAFYLASLAIGAGIRNIVSAMGDPAAFRSLGAAATEMLFGVARGAAALVASPFVRFWVASKSISAGIRNIVGSFTQADVAKVNEMTTAMRQLAVTSGSMAAGLNVETMTKTASTVTVKTELEDRRISERNRLIHMELLTAIKNGIGELGAAVKSISGTDVAEHIDEVKKLLAQYLPEIAESDKGLASLTNQWSTGS